VRARATSAVATAVDKADGAPVVVDGDALVVDEPGVEADPLYVTEAEIGLELGASLRVRDPEPVRRPKRSLQPREAPLELAARGGEVDDDRRAGLRAELLRQRRRRIVACGQR
jgi:hypothetical protein